MPNECKVPFLAPLVAQGIQVITRMRKDAVAWDERMESATKKTVKMKGEWKLAHLLQEFMPQKLSCFTILRRDLEENATRSLCARSGNLRY